MDAKLKSLKVTDLKEILSKASIPPGNAKKQDLINKILANPAAIDVFYALHPAAIKPDVPLPPNDDLLAPPEEVDWTVEEVIPTPSKSTQRQLPPKPSPRSKEPPAPEPEPEPATIVPSPPVQSTSTKTLPPTEDEEAVKRKARAARFNIDYVEPKQSSPRRQKKEKISIVSSSDDPEKLKARAERFGISITKTAGKRTAPVDQDQVDPEEQERRKKRAQRFGQISGTKA